MIKANELRLGNWLNGYDPSTMDHNKKGYFRVFNIEEDKINVWRVEGFPNEYATGEPIPLTPQILERCGFEKGNMPFTGDYGYIIEDKGAGYFIGLIDNEQNGFMFHNPHFNRSYKYLHQLQNLVFDLTGEELIFNTFRFHPQIN